ncbi:MAG: hypothetical protein IPL32_18380 [Chloracidobacterium sp.]|nr:hypothetical protein [Chloracidobacterium sp.]
MQDSLFPLPVSVGAPTPKWADWFDQLDTRQQSEVLFAWTYARTFGHGTDGHNRLFLIDRLADLLQAAHAEIARLRLNLAGGDY